MEYLLGDEVRRNGALLELDLGAHVAKKVVEVIALGGFNRLVDGDGKALGKE